MTPAGFPHSEIPGSKPVCGSPRLIAAYHVLHRLSAPRHPPCTLSSLTNLLNPILYPANPIASYPIQLSKNKTHSGVHAGLDSTLPSHRTFQAQLVGLGRFELPTSRLSGVRSNQLSYRPSAGKPIPWKLGRGLSCTVERST
jgi:hypothetical protein